jgi:hypothetical protein
LHGRKGELLRDSIADFESFRPVSTGWPASIGIGGRLPSESAAGLRRNQWPASVGIRMLEQEMNTDDSEEEAVQRLKLAITPVC